jgi:tetratricopeptide (TPR) repeat protein
MPALTHPTISRLLLLALLLMTMSRLSDAVADASDQRAFLEANRLYEADRFDDAIEAYLALDHQGLHSAALHFNLANALLLSDQTGRAILHYRIAQQLNPRDPDILANLQFARLQTGLPQPHARQPWRRLLDRLTLNEWTFLAAASLWSLLALLSLRQILPRSRRPFRPIVALLALLTCLTLAALSTAWREFHRPIAIVVVPEAIVRFGPFEESRLHYTLPNGAEIHVRDQLDNWFQIVDSSGRIGWLQEDQIVRFHGADSIKRTI